MTILQSSIASNVISGATGATGPSGTNGTNGAVGATGASPWSLSGSDTYYTVGNVGIGTASPASKLDVKAGTGSVISRSTSGTNFKAFYDDGRTTYTSVNYDGLSTTGAQDLIITAGAGASQVMQFRTSDTERMRIDGSGNVGLGTTSPANKLEVSNGASDVAVLVKATGANYATYRMKNTSQDYSMQIRTDQSNAWTLRDETDGVNRLLVTTDGDFLMAPDYRTEPRGKVDISAVGGTVSGLPSVCLAMSRWGDAGIMVNFFPNHGSTTSIGNIYNAGLTNTQYNTSSDYRLKENIAPMTGALAKIALLKPCTYTWKSTQADGQGFIAHELQEVFPDAVCGEKDAVDGEGNIVSQGLDTSYLVATLTAAIQEQQAMIEELKAEVAALKGNN